MYMLLSWLTNQADKLRRSHYPFPRLKTYLQYRRYVGDFEFNARYNNVSATLLQFAKIRGDVEVVYDEVTLGFRRN